MTNKIIISSFADEYSHDPVVHAEYLNSRGVGYIEPRFVGEKNISDLAENEVKEYKKILSAKDKFGFVYFKCETDKGVCEFVVRNPFGSIIRVSDTRIFIVDIDSNRYSVRDVSALDRASYKKIELYI